MIAVIQRVSEASVTIDGILTGSIGLIGGQLLELLLSDNQYSSVIAISRKPLSFTNPKLINLVCELRDLANHSDQLKADDVFCCLGATVNGEDAAKFFYKVLGFLIPKKYKAIQSSIVPKGMLQLASSEKSGILIHESNQIRNFK